MLGAGFRLQYFTGSGSIPNEKTDDCTATEPANGDVFLNMRNSDRRFPNIKKVYAMPAKSLGVIQYLT